MKYTVLPHIAAYMKPEVRYPAEYSDSTIHIPPLLRVRRCPDYENERWRTDPLLLMPYWGFLLKIKGYWPWRVRDIAADSIDSIIDWIGDYGHQYLDALSDWLDDISTWLNGY